MKPRTRLIPATLATLTLALALSSCNPGTSGIFATLETEKKLDSLGTMDAKATLTSMAEYGGNYYVVGNGILYKKTTSTTDTAKWAKTPVAGNSEVLAVQSVGTLALYALAGDGSTNKVYWLNGANWDEVTVTAGNPTDLIPVVDATGIHAGTSVSGVLVVCYDATTGYNRVDLLNSGVTVAGVAANLVVSGTTTSLNNPVIAAVDDGTTYILLLSRSYLWTAARANLGSPALVTTLPAGEDFAALVATGASSLYLATRDVKGTTGGSLYRGTTSGASLSAFATNVQVTSLPVNFTTLYAHSSGSVLAGTLNNGYGEITGSSYVSTPSATVDSGDYDSHGLPTATITFFYRAPTSGTLFLGTNSLGLWSQSTSSKTWTQQ